ASGDEAAGGFSCRQRRPRRLVGPWHDKEPLRQGPGRAGIRDRLDRAGRSAGRCGPGGTQADWAPRPRPGDRPLRLRHPWWDRDLRPDRLTSPVAPAIRHQAEGRILGRKCPATGSTKWGSDDQRDGVDEPLRPPGYGRRCAASVYLAHRMAVIVSSISSRCATRNGGFSNSAMRSRLCALTSAAPVERYAVIADSQKWLNCAITIVNEP